MLVGIETLRDLWDLADYRRGLTMVRIAGFLVFRKGAESFSTVQIRPALHRAGVVLGADTDRHLPRTVLCALCASYA